MGIKKTEAGKKLIKNNQFEFYQLITIFFLLILFITCLISFFLGFGRVKNAITAFLLLFFYALLIKVVNSLRYPAIVLQIQSLLTILTLFVLYYLLGFMAFEVIPYSGDPFLAAVDNILGLGTNPVIWAEQFVSPFVLESFSFIYAFFIPYLYFSIFLSLIGRPLSERRIFIIAFALTYSAGFLGYLFVPARGPVIFLADQFMSPLQGGYFHNLVVNSIAKSGGPHGAFPSLHVGASALICLFDLRFNRVRGMIYVPFVLAICCSTILLRYHYVVDLLAGFLIAFISIKLAIHFSKISPNMGKEINKGER